MTKSRYNLLALGCCLCIPCVVVAGTAIFAFIDPEWARGYADYARNFHLIAAFRTAVLIASAAVALLLWLLCCAFMIKARQRSLFWLVTALAGPLAIPVLVFLGDKTPEPQDFYQRFLRGLRFYWRIPLQLAIYWCIMSAAYWLVMLREGLMTRYEAFATHVPVSVIVAQQNASSGMWAFSEGLQTMFLFTLGCLLWPVAFNLAARLLAGQPAPTRPIR